LPACPEPKLYIGGEWQTADGAPVVHPHDESVPGTVPHAALSDLDNALAAAEHGFRIWSRTSPAMRARDSTGIARLEQKWTVAHQENGEPGNPAAR
jgi:acyl-CoA reductase-like NAD-dependent aldehyde dehydrogenase